ncbi:MAG: acyl carrier protein [Lachnospiraceae bacterium]
MIFETVRELLAYQLEVSPESITPETDIFEDLGADSLDVVELVMSIEEEYDIVITDERAGNVPHRRPGGRDAERPHVK